MKKSIFGILIIIAGAESIAASFDCAKARSPVEKQSVQMAS